MSILFIGVLLQTLGLAIEFASREIVRVLICIEANTRKSTNKRREDSLQSQYSDDKVLAAAQEAAKKAKRELFGDPRFVEPWDWRKLSKEERDKLR